MTGAEDGGVGIEAVGAGGFVAVVAGLIGAVLPRVEDEEIGEAAVVDLAEELDVGTVRERGATQRHVFVVSLVSGGAVFEEILACGVEDFGDVVAVIVLHFVIVRRDDPGGVGVRGLKSFVGFVEGVAVSVIVDSEECGLDLVYDLASALHICPSGHSTLIVPPAKPRK